jgi:4-amino-4-deoxy-L-arabinose transferase-like glycosyltransferase
LHVHTPPRPDTQASTAALSADRTRFDPFLWATLALASAFRWYRIDIPYVDAHSWRQVTNADIARLWTELPINPLFPQVSWGGPDGYAGLEFPLLHVLTALVWRAVGVSDVAGRLVAVAFSLASVWLIYLLGRRLFNVAVGRGAAFLLAFSPSFVYFGRTLLSDVPMVTFSIAAVLGYAAYFETNRHRDAVLGAICLALAGLVKIPAILILGPIIWLGWLARRWRLLYDAAFATGLVVALGTIAAWYLHADRIYLETGLTQAIFRPSSRYIGEIAAYSGVFTTVSHWTTWGDPENRAFVLDIVGRFLHMHLTPLGAVGVALGFVRFTTPRRTVLDIWVLAAASLVAVSLVGQYFHEFHQLPFHPPLALFFGLGLQPLFAWERWPLALERRRVAGTLAATMFVVLSGTAIWCFVESSVFLLYRPNNLNTPLIDAGRAIDQATPNGSLLVVVEYERAGSNSPMLLYYARRRGWSFDALAIRSTVVDYLRDQRGACFFATSGWPLIEALEPETAQHLRAAFKEIPLPGIRPDYRLFDLGCSAPSPST